VLVHRGLFREAVDMLTPAVKQLDPMQAEWVHANGALAVAEAGSGRYTAGLARAEAGVTRARNLQRFALLAPANNYLGFVHMMGGDWERVQDIHQQQSADATKMQLAVQGALDTLECAGHALRRDHQPEHRARMRDILTQDGGATQADPRHRADQQPVLGAWHGALHARLALHLGELDTAIKHAEAARKLAQQREDSFGLGLALHMLGRARAASGAPASDIDDLMRQSRDVLTKAGCTLEAARTQATWGELMLERGDRNGIDRLRDALRILEEAGIKGAEIDAIKALIAQSDA